MTSVFIFGVRWNEGGEMIRLLELITPLRTAIARSTKSTRAKKCYPNMKRFK